jgi:DNA-directed RNA polymerase specialized sigma24 family protein
MRQPRRPSRLKEAAPMDPEGSVTRWISRLKDGDRAAAEALWRAYFHRLVALARDRLRGTPRRAADEEDVALAAFDSFYRRAERGQFPRLEGRDDLWQLLFVLTARKAVDLTRREARQPGRDARGGSPREPIEPDIELVLGTEPTPEFAAVMADECRRLLDRLGDETLRSVAVWKMEGQTNAAIAARLGCGATTVERKLQRIRDLWTRGGIS